MNPCGIEGTECIRNSSLIQLKTKCGRVPQGFPRWELATAGPKAWVALSNSQFVRVLRAQLS